MIVTNARCTMLIAVGFSGCDVNSPASAQFVEEVTVIHEIRGEAPGDQFGWIARRIPDADGDGIADFTASAPYKVIDGAANTGRIYTYSGRTGKLLWTADGTAGSFLGINVESAGDVNGDGIGDVIAGAPGAKEAWVYSGRDGRVLHHLTSPDPEQRTAYGRTTALAGDVDGDGHGDLLVGAPFHDAKGDRTGRVYLISGADGSTMRTFEGEAAGHTFGSTISGYSDADHSLLVIGAQNAGAGQRGRVYVYDGRSGDVRFIIEAKDTGKNLGRMFASVLGDVNADGVPDVYCSDWEDNTNHAGAGRIYVNSGKDGSLLFTKHGEAAGDGFGIGNGDAGDVNGDGHDDLIIGAWQHGSGAASGGRCYLIDGRDGAIMSTFTSNVANETWGFDTTGLGDVDGDGSIDLLITSAYSPINGKKSGRIFVISSGVARDATSRPAD